MLAVWQLPDRRLDNPAALLRLPYYPTGSLPYGLAILLAWACVGLVIALLPSILKQHGLASWSGFSTFCVISCGLLFQPLAKRLAPVRATAIGLVILPCSYALLAWGADSGALAAVLLGTIAASSACYGFVYLGGLSAVNTLAGEEKTRASAGFFLLAYMGFSLPVILTGLLVDRLGPGTALLLFGLVLLAGCLLVGLALVRSHKALAVPTLATVK
ncbi:Major Facilitator Superfamily protein [compost metagenome]